MATEYVELQKGFNLLKFTTDDRHPAAMAVLDPGEYKYKASKKGETIHVLDGYITLMPRGRSYVDGECYLDPNEEVTIVITVVTSARIIYRSF